jgi:hypothetical protein
MSEDKIVSSREVTFKRDANGELLSATINDRTHRITAGAEKVHFEYESGISRELLVKNIKEILECVAHPTFPLY